MFSSPTPAPGSRAIASNALRNAGLIDRDAPMRDVSGGRKGTSKIRSHRTRPIDAFKDSTSGPSKSMLASRIQQSHAGPSDPLAIRGAARPTAAGRMRRNAVSASESTTGGTTQNRPRPRPRIPVSVVPVGMKAVEAWREVVNKRWNAETRFLNLEGLVDDELVKKHNLTPPGHGGTLRDASVIFKLAGQLKPAVETLSLASNNLIGQHLTYLHRYLPNLVNLSLQNNKLRNWKDMDYFAERKKMTYLRELILIGNPIRDQEYKSGRGDKYRNEISRRFSSLQILDSEPIAQIAFDVPQPPPSAAPVQEVPTATTFPCEMGPSFITGVDGAFVSNFLARFFSFFDTQRAALRDVYDEASTFSYSANTSIPVRARIEGHQHTKPNQKKLNWAPWLGGGDGGSRNLTRIGQGYDRTIKSLHIGGDAAVKAMTALPGTSHDIGGPPEKFCVDSFPVVHGQGMGLLVTIHGEFTEAGSQGIRSFDRTFILAPAAEGSRAKLSGWDVVILSDQWIVRAYSNPDAWKPGPMLVQAQPRREQQARSAQVVQANGQQQPTAPSIPLDQQAILASLSEGQRSLVMQISQRTRLNVKFSVDCLAGNEWDLERAVANFEQVKGTLSREAFL